MSITELSKNVHAKVQEEYPGLSTKCVKAIVDATFEEVKNITKQAGTCRVPNFATFKVYTRKERVAKHPQTGADLVIPEQESIKVSIGKGFKEEVQKG